MSVDSSNFYEDNNDMQFHIDSIIDWGKIVPLREQGFKDYQIYQETNDDTYAFAVSNTEEAVEQYKAVLEGLGQISAKELKENARPIDEQGFQFKDGQVIFPEPMKKNVNVLIENGYMGLLSPRKYGGMQVPNTVNVMAIELVSTGDVGSGTLVFCQDLADIIARYSDNEEQKAKWIPKIASGEMGAAMLLTEPNYGSDLQNAQTKGEFKDGKWYISGTKMWITHGAPHTDAGTVYLTVTRTVRKNDGSLKAGGGGLSLLLTHSDDVEITSLEHKLGIHSSPTVMLSLDNTPGELVGEEGKGLTEYTMALMNAARLTVAAQSVGASEIALRESVKYANERVQFGVLIKEIPAVAQMLREMEISLQASRALTYHTAWVVDIYEGLEQKFKNEGKTAREMKKDEEFLKWSKLAKVLTPFSKYYTAEEANTNAYKAIQVHGGVGYSEEYDVARIYRDARILSIYEGTSQLQVVAAIGGVSEGYSKENSIFLQYQRGLRDSVQIPDALKNHTQRLVEAEKMIMDIMEPYKASSKEFKGSYQGELVWAAAMVFIAHLFLIMSEKNEEKISFAKDYLNETYVTTKAVTDKIRLQLEDKAE